MHYSTCLLVSIVESRLLRCIAEFEADWLPAPAPAPALAPAPGCCSDADMGFTSPLIMKVAAEIKASFPDIFNPEDDLTDFWVYNYDNNDLLTGAGTRFSGSCSDKHDRFTKTGSRQTCEKLTGKGVFCRWCTWRRLR